MSLQPLGEDGFRPREEGRCLESRAINLVLERGRARMKSRSSSWWNRATTKGLRAAFRERSLA